MVWSPGTCAVGAHDRQASRRTARGTMLLTPIRLIRRLKRRLNLRRLNLRRSWPRSPDFSRNASFVLNEIVDKQLSEFFGGFRVRGLIGPCL